VTRAAGAWLAIAAALVGGSAPGAPATTRPAAPTVAVFVPTHGPAAAIGEAIRRGVALAVWDAAARRGGAPLIHLVVVPSDQPWATGLSELVRLRYEEGLVAIVAGATATDAHLAAQFVARERGDVVLLIPWAADASLTRIPLPWVFRLTPDDQQQAAVLVKVLAQSKMNGSVAVIGDSSADARAAAEAFVHAAAGRRLIRLTLANPNETAQAADVVHRAGCRAAVLCAPPVGDLMSRLRALRPRPALVAFLAAVPSAEGSDASCLMTAPPPAVQARFAVEFVRAFGERPVPAAGYGYDAAQILCNALRRHGATLSTLSQVIRGTVATGVTGTIRFAPGGARVFPQLETMGIGSRR